MKYTGEHPQVSVSNRLALMTDFCWTLRVMANDWCQVTDWRVGLTYGKLAVLWGQTVSASNGCLKGIALTIDSQGPAKVDQPRQWVLVWFPAYCSVVWTFSHWNILKFVDWMVAAISKVKLLPTWQATRVVWRAYSIIITVVINCLYFSLL